MEYIAVVVVIWLASRWITLLQRAVKDRSDLRTKAAQINELIGVLALKTAAAMLILVVMARHSGIA